MHAILSGALVRLVGEFLFVFCVCPCACLYVVSLCVRVHV